MWESGAETSTSTTTSTKYHEPSTKHHDRPPPNPPSTKYYCSAQSPLAGRLVHISVHVHVFFQKFAACGAPRGAFSSPTAAVAGSSPCSRNPGSAPCPGARPARVCCCCCKSGRCGDVGRTTTCCCGMPVLSLTNAVACSTVLNLLCLQFDTRVVNAYACVCQSVATPLNPSSPPTIA